MASRSKSDLQAPGSATQLANLAAALTVFLGGALILLGAALEEVVSRISADLEVAWVLSALALWAIGGWQMTRARRKPRRVWLLAALWGLSSFVAPIAILLVGAAWTAGRISSWVRRLRLTLAPQPGPRRAATLGGALGIHVGLAFAWLLGFGVLGLMLGAWERSVDASATSAEWSSRMLTFVMYVAGALWLLAALVVVWWWAGRRPAVWAVPLGWLAVAGVGALVAVIGIAAAE